VPVPAPAAALVAAAVRSDLVDAVVSRGGPSDLRVPLMHVRAPTLLICRRKHIQVIQLNREALARCAAKSNS